MTTKRLRREDWLELGLKQLAEEGPTALKLANICAAAGLTRGSFYHHFLDHSAFLEAMVHHRHEEETRLLDDMLPPELDPASAMDTFTDLALALDYRLELGLRELARAQKLVARAMAAVDKTRLARMIPLYSARYGIPKSEARDAALLEYSTFLGLMLMNPDRSEEDQRRLYDVYMTMQTARYETNEGAKRDEPQPALAYED